METVSVLPLHLHSNKQLTPTKMSSFFPSVCPFVILMKHPYCGFNTQHGAMDLLKRGHVQYPGLCQPVQLSVYSPLSRAAPRFCFLSSYNIYMHPHSLSVRFVAPSSERLFGTEHFFLGSVLVSKTTWEAVHNGSVALPSVTLSSLSKVRLVSRVHHHLPH